MDVYSWPGYSNGNVPLDALVRLNDDEGQWVSVVGRYAHPEVATRVRWVLAECRRQGLNSIYPNEIYRDFAGQVYWKQWWTNAGNPGNAATPGYSPHGWGKAVDWNFAISEWAAFKAIADRAGMEMNISGEDWHTGATQDSTVDLTANSVPAAEDGENDMAFSAAAESDLDARFALIVAPLTDLQKKVESLVELPATQASFAATVDGQYLDVLGRHADVAGLAMFVSLMTHANWTTDQVRQALLASDEYKSRWIAMLYHTLLGREASADDIHNWLPLSFTAIEGGIRTSPEFLARHA